MYFTVVFEGADEMYKKRFSGNSGNSNIFFKCSPREIGGFRFFQFDGFANLFQTGWNSTTKHRRHLPEVPAQVLREETPGINVC